MMIIIVWYFGIRWYMIVYNGIYGIIIQVKGLPKIN